jgi:hypothetical protein
MDNINTKEYWDKRFSSGSWDKIGQLQTYEYAKSNVSNISLNKNFEGTLLDFGCAMGNALVVYKEAFPKARLIGTDISESGIESCKKNLGDIAEFISGDFSVIPTVDVIIASHVMEHLTDDKTIVKNLLQKCKDLYIFVPYKETPLHHEHVNYYDDDYYNEFNVINKKTFIVRFKIKLPFIKILTRAFRFNFSSYRDINTDVIMYQLQK